MLIINDFYLKLLDKIPKRIRIRYGKKLFKKNIIIALKFIEQGKIREAIFYLLVANKFRPRNIKCLTHLCVCYLKINANKFSFYWGQELIIQHSDKNIGYELCSDLLRIDINLVIRNEIFNLMEDFTVTEMIKRRDSKTYPCWWVFCNEYYKYVIRDYCNITDKQRERHLNDENPRVFIFVNRTKESDTSSHLAILADIMNMYERINIECHLLISPHPYSGVGNFGSIGMRHAKLSDKELQKKIKKHLINLVGPAINTYRVECLFNLSEKNLKVKDYCLTTIKRMAAYNINNQDIVFLIGGWCGSTLLTTLSAYLPARKYFLMFSGNNPYGDVVNIADYILHPSASFKPFTTKASELGFSNNQVLQNIIMTRPFRWEEKNSKDFSLDENKFLEDLKSRNPELLLVTAALNLELRFNTEFCKLILEMININPNIYFSFIGTNEEKIYSFFPDLRKYNNNFIFLEFSEYLFSLYKEISEYNSVYIFPRDCGSGRSNVYAAYAEIPVILFRGNDAESQLPEFCFVETQEEMIIKINKLSTDPGYKENYIKLILKDRNERIKKSETLYLGLTDIVKYPKITKPLYIS